MANNKVSPVTAGVVGAVVGAAVGAAAVALSDDKTRKNIGKKFNEVKGKVEDMASGVSDKVKGAVSDAGDKVEDAKEALKKKL